MRDSYKGSMVMYKIETLRSLRETSTTAYWIRTHSDDNYFFLLECKALGTSNNKKKYII